MRHNSISSVYTIAKAKPSGVFCNHLRPLIKGGFGGESFGILGYLDFCSLLSLLWMLASCLEMNCREGIEYLEFAIHNILFEIIHFRFTIYIFVKETSSSEVHCVSCDTV